MPNPKVPLILLCLLLPLCLFAGDKELFNYPDIYNELFGDSLKTYEDVADGVDFFKDSNADGIVLLNEYRRYTTDDNVRYDVEHLIYYSKDESGAESNGRETFSYRKSNQKIYLVKGFTRQADGAIAEVQENAVFIQASQKDADSELFSDFEEMVVIFPDVKPGSVTECIVLRVTTDPIAPDEYTCRTIYQSGWPTYLRFKTIDLPESFGKRMRFVPLGKGVPEPELEIANGRYLWTFFREKTDKFKYEPSRMSLVETGPALFGTTFESWDTVAAWSRGLVKERNTLNQDLKDTVDEWTKDAQSEQEIIEIITEHIANDVRYTGLEFGIAGYQPHDCNVVWDNKYGDCKDKANLLASCLQYKGIDAYIAMIDTDGFGSFPEDCPSPFYFNHAITAIRQGDHFLFFDPTIEKLQVGDLSGGDINRKALVVTEDHGELASTPLIDLGTIHWNFNLDLSSSAEITGWVQLFGKRYFKSWYQSVFEKYSQEDLRWKAHDFVTGFYPAAETSDAILHLEEDNMPLLEAFFSLGAASQQSNGKISVKLPDVAWMLSNVGDTSERETDYAIYPGTKQLSLSLNLPQGWDASALPDPVNFSNRYFDFKAAWIITGNTLKADMKLTFTKDRLPSGEFADLYNQTKAVQRWLGTPVIIEPLNTNLAETSDRSVESFPRLKTAQGQLALIRQWYPDDSNKPRERRAALEKLIEWFPEDAATLFEAQMEIIRIDMEGGDPQQILDQVTQALELYGHAINDKNKAWGLYLQAMELEQLQRFDEALDIYIDLLSNDNLSSYRRSWSCNQAASILRKNDDDRLIPLIEQTLEYESEAQINLGAHLVLFYLKAGRLNDAKEFLSRKQAFYGDDYQRVLNMVENTLKIDGTQYEGAIPDTWYQCLAGLKLENGQYLNLLAEAKGRSLSKQMSKRIRTNAKNLAKWLSRNTPDWYKYKNGLPNGMTEEQLIANIQSDEKNSDWINQMNHLLLYISNYTDNPDTYFLYYYWTLFDLYKFKFDEDLALALGNPLKDYSPLISNVAEAYLKWFDLQLDYMNKPQDALAWSEYMLNEPELSLKYKGVMGIRRAWVLKRTGNPEQAVDTYLEISSCHEFSAEVYHGLWIGWLTAKDLDRTQAASEFQSILMDASKEDLKKIRTEYAIQKLQEYKGQEDKLLLYADKTKEWNQAWDELAIECGYNNSINPNNLKLFINPGSIAESINALVKEQNPQSEIQSFILLYSLAMQAQWLPSFCLDLANEFQALPDSFAYHDKMQKLIIERLKSCQDYLPDGQRYIAIQALADTYFANNQIMNGQILLRDTLKNEEIPREWEEKLTLQWAHSVQSSGLGKDQPFNMLLGWLSQRPMKEIRAEVVDLIVTQWQTEGSKEDDIIQLLNREIKNADIQKDVERLKKFSKILQQSDNEHRQVADYIKAVKDWRTDRNFPWWNVILPLGLDDPRIANMETFSNQGNLNNLERCKALLLSIEKGEDTLESLSGKFTDVILGMKSLSLFPDEIYVHLDSINAYPELAKRHGNLPQIAKLIFALYMKDTEAAIGAYGDGKHINESWRGGFQAMLEYVKQNPDTPEAKFEALSKICKEPIFQETYNFIQYRCNELIIEGRSDLPRRLLTHLKTSPIHPSFNQTAFQLRITLGKSIQFMEQVLPYYQFVNDAFTPYVNAPYQPTSHDCYNLVSDYFPTESLPAVACYFSSGENGNDENLWNLSDAFIYFSLQPSEVQLKVLDQLDQFLEQQSDALVQNCIAECLYRFDQDDPLVQKRIGKMCDKYIKADDNENFASVFWNLKLGYLHKHQDWAAIKKTTIPSKVQYAPSLDYILSLGAYENSDNEELASYCKNIPQWSYDNDYYYITLYAINKAMGDDIIADLFKEALPDYLQKKVFGVFSEGNFPYSLITELHLFNILNTEELIPITDYHIAHTRSDGDRYNLMAVRDFIAGDWENCRSNIAQSIKLIPNHVGGKFYLGVANYHLGNFEEAKKELMEYCAADSEPILIRHAKELIREMDQQ